MPGIDGRFERGEPVELAARFAHLRDEFWRSKVDPFMRRKHRIIRVGHEAAAVKICSDG
ncbi:hypothetical protein [Arenibaculum pallidiluteum]|uniref:hypothetical protein n=1 Tax=Arenibaculum pallidiluteum TaxID=2812559 RepID=UPI001A96DDAE|nr:hypothetical protein [Arenibaculum pallidiluteum]